MAVADQRGQGRRDRVEGTSERTRGIAPGQSVGFLLSQLGYETARRFGELMHEVHLEPRQFALMRAIEVSEGQSQNAVAESLHIPPSSMVAVIDDLQSRGLVERRPHPSDRRTHSLHLTADGKRLLKEATKLAVSFEAVVSKGLTGEQRLALIAQLSRIAENLGLVRGVHPDTSTGHGRPHWTAETGAASG
jgi:DNA-binding MarR family transcriptional regulator